MNAGWTGRDACPTKLHVPHEWIKEFIDIAATPEEVAERLTIENART